MSVLKNILPRYHDLAGLDRQAAEINSYHESGEISQEDRDRLLANLVVASVREHESDDQEQQILLAQCVRALALVPVAK